MGSTPVNVFLPQVTRIPIAGPAPFNTLVCCTTISFAGLPGAGAGFTTRGEVRLPTNFVLQGFDQRVAPNFQHSTSGWLTQIGPSQDDNWLYAIDSIADAGFDPFGNFFVDFNIAVQFGQLPGGGLQAFIYGVCICSYVLVNEPPVSQPGGQGQARIAVQGLQPPPSGFPRIHVSASSTPAPLFTANLLTSPAPPSQLLRCRCECDCYRKGKCVKHKRGCNCSYDCCQP